MNFFKEIRFPYIVRILAFWMAYFALFRLIFIIYHHARIPDQNHGETVYAFLHALRMDFSTACAISIPSFILWALQKFKKTELTHKTNKYMNYVFIGIATFINIANIKLYGDWGSLIGAKELNEIFSRSEFASIISKWSIILMLLMSSVFIFISIKLYQLVVANFSAPIDNIYFKAGKILFMAAILIIGFRGGFQKSIIGKKSVYYSQHKINNHIAVNHLWYLTTTVIND